MDDDGNKVLNKQEIDLNSLIEKVWNSRLFIIKVSTAFVLLGLFIAFTSKIEFKSGSKLVPENQEGVKTSFGNLGSLAGLAGIDLDMPTNSTLTPDLYPEIVKSTTFLLEIMYSEIYFENLDTTINIYQYFDQFNKRTIWDIIYDYSFGLPYTIKNYFGSSSTEIKPEIIHSSELGIVRLTKNETETIENLKKRISVSFDQNTGIITISSSMPDKIAAARLTTLVVKGLTNKIIQYKTEKSIRNESFINDRFKEAKNDYEKKQEELAKFIDRNKNLSSSFVQIESQNLQNQVSISFEVYKSLASQLEQAKIKVKEETPIFTILEPVKVPIDKDEPKRGIIIIISFMLGIMVGVTYAIVKN